jgi:hypothetical protein
MEELLLIIFAFAFGWFAREWLAMRKINVMISRMEEISSNVIRIKIQRVNGMLYIHNMETHEFMAQGNTRKQLEQNLSSRFPDTKFAATAENLKEVFANDNSL